MSDGKSIKHWLEDDRPREKMVQKGAQALSNAELLTILIGSGTRKKSALDLAKETLALAGNNIAELGRLSIADMQAISGIGEARAVTISAALELGRRRQMAEGMDRQLIKTPEDGAAIVRPILQDLTYECFCAVYLNAASKVIKYELVSHGGLTATVVDIRIIMKSALMCQASSIMVAHNHPSGNTVPSDSDKYITARLHEAARIMEMKLFDHIIIGGASYFSFRDEGLL